MHLPNHPDTLYEFISALKDCGYRWLLVQEHSVETLSGEPLSQSQKYLPNQLTARNSSGDTVKYEMMGTSTAVSKVQQKLEVGKVYEFCKLGVNPPL